MTQTITRLYDSYDTALRASLALKESGFTDRELSLVGAASTPRHGDLDMESVSEDAGTGAGLGGVIGAAAGLMAGMGVLSIPGLGPVVAAGWLASTVAAGAVGAVAGGATGSVVGALAGIGTSDAEAEAAAHETAGRGDSLVTVRVPDERVTEAARILAGFTTAATMDWADPYRSGDKPDVAPGE